jgi:hypothetical protein
MKRRDLIRSIEQLAKENGVEWVQGEGSKHDKYTFNGRMIPIPRHREIGEMLAREIIKQCKNAL